MRNHGNGKQSETQYAFRGLWAQAGQGIRRGRAQAGAGEREGDHLPQQRGGDRHPQSVQQSTAGGGGQALKTGRIHGPASLQIIALLLCCALFLAGCGSRKRAAQTSVPSAPVATLPTTPAAAAQPELSFPADAPVLFTETGWASWYGPNYHQRKASNGEVFDMNSLSAAHRTLPLNSEAVCGGRHSGCSCRRLRHWRPCARSEEHTSELQSPDHLVCR